MRDKAVFTTFEAAKLCHVSPLSIINWVNAGRLPAFRTPGGHRRIRREDLVRLAKTWLDPDGFRVVITR